MGSEDFSRLVELLGERGVMDRQAEQAQHSEQVLQALRGLTHIELLSLNPMARDWKAPVPVADAFHGWPVLGGDVLADTTTRIEVVEALGRGIAEGWTVAACFVPRHGVRARDSDGRYIDLVICFECCQLHMFASSGQVWMRTTGSPEAVLDRVLAAAGVDLGPRRSTGPPSPPPPEKCLHCRGSGDCYCKRTGEEIAACARCGGTARCHVCQGSGYKPVPKPAEPGAAANRGRSSV